MKKQIVAKWIRGVLFIFFEVFILIGSLTMNEPFNQKVFAFLILSILLLFIFFWLSSLITCVFEKSNPHRWRDFLIILLFNVFGAMYCWRARQIRNYQPPKDPEIFNHHFTQWLDKNHFSFEKCIEQRKNAKAFGAVMGLLWGIVMGLSFGLKYALSFIPDRLSPFVFILPMLGLLVFFLKYIYRDWKRTDHIPFVLSLMFLQADAGNNAKGMMFFDKEEPYYKKPSLSFIFMGDFFLFFSIIFGASALGILFGTTQMMEIYLGTGGITLAFGFLFISLQFQTSWFIYFHPNRIFSVIKHYQAWKTASTILATLPVFGFIIMYIILFIKELF